MPIAEAYCRDTADVRTGKIHHVIAITTVDADGTRDDRICDQHLIIPSTEAGPEREGGRKGDTRKCGAAVHPEERAAACLGRDDPIAA